MKTRFTHVCILLTAAALSATAGDTTQKLAVRMRNERSGLIDAVVQGWCRGENDEKMSVLIARLVDVDARLSVFSASAGADSVLTDVKVKGASRPAQLAGAIARAYYRRKGLVVATRDSFNGIYMLYPSRERI